MKGSESFDKCVPDLCLDHFSQHIYTKLLVIIVSAFVTTMLINAMVRTYTEPFLGPLYTLPLKDPRTSWISTSGDLNAAAVFLSIPQCY